LKGKPAEHLFLPAQPINAGKRKIGAVAGRNECRIKADQFEIIPPDISGQSRQSVYRVCFVCIHNLAAPKIRADGLESASAALGIF